MRRRRQRMRHAHSRNRLKRLKPAQAIRMRHVQLDNLPDLDGNLRERNEAEPTTTSDSADLTLLSDGHACLDSQTCILFKVVWLLCPHFVVEIVVQPKVPRCRFFVEDRIMRSSAAWLRGADACDVGRGRWSACTCNRKRHKSSVLASLETVVKYTPYGSRIK